MNMCDHFLLSPVIESSTVLFKQYEPLVLMEAAECQAPQVWIFNLYDLCASKKMTMKENHSIIIGGKF